MFRLLAISLVFFAVTAHAESLLTSPARLYCQSQVAQAFDDELVKLASTHTKQLNTVETYVGAIDINGWQAAPNPASRTENVVLASVQGSYLIPNGFCAPNKTLYVVTARVFLRENTCDVLKVIATETADNECD